MKEAFPARPPAGAVLDPERLRLRSALLDRATGLASFHLHLDTLRSMLDDRRSIAVLHVSCGELGLVESIYGWQILDRLMKRAAEIVTGLKGDVFSQRSVVALNGVAGEEILVFDPGDAESPGAAPIARMGAELAAALAEGFGSEEYAAMTPQLLFHVGTSELSENPYFRFERLVYRAVEQARTQHVRREEQQLEQSGAELRGIIRDARVAVRFQPVLELGDLEVVGYEALSGATDGPLASPGMMFALSDRLGISRDLDRVCRRSAVAAAGGLADGRRLFLNTRPWSLADPDWAQGFAHEILEPAGLSPDRVVIEIPEAALHETEALAEPVAALKKQGYSIALDDVGTGYSLLLAAEALQPDFLKIDVSIVQDVDRSLLRQEVVGSILEVAESAGAAVVAEGIETVGQLDSLRRSGVRFGQGFLFARPGPRIEPPSIDLELP